MFDGVFLLIAAIFAIPHVYYYFVWTQSKKFMKVHITTMNMNKPWFPIT